MVLQTRHISVSGEKKVIFYLVFSSAIPCFHNKSKCDGDSESQACPLLSELFEENKDEQTLYLLQTLKFWGQQTLVGGNNSKAEFRVVFVSNVAHILILINYSTTQTKITHCQLTYSFSLWKPAFNLLSEENIETGIVWPIDCLMTSAFSKCNTEWSIVSVIFTCSP